MHALPSEAPRPLGAMISATDLETLNRATLRLYASDAQVGNWIDRAFEFLGTLVSADMVNYGALDLRTGAMQVATTCDRSNWPTAVAGFGAFMRKYAYFNFDPSVNDGRPFFRSDFISGRQFRDTDIWCECFRLLETMDHAAVHVPTNDSSWTWFSAERGGTTDFSARDRLMLTLGQQHLANSWQLDRTRQKVRDEVSIAPDTFSAAGFTPRESEVAYWLTEGKTNAEIAALLRLHLQTVKGHVTALFNKTGTGNRLALSLHLLELVRTILRPDPRTKTFAVREW